MHTLWHAVERDYGICNQVQTHQNGNRDLPQTDLDLPAEGLPETLISPHCLGSRWPGSGSVSTIWLESRVKAKSPCPSSDMPRAYPPAGVWPHICWKNVLLMWSLLGDMGKVEPGSPGLAPQPQLGVTRPLTSSDYRRGLKWNHSWKNTLCTPWKTASRVQDYWYYYCCG